VLTVGHGFTPSSLRSYTMTTTTIRFPCWSCGKSLKASNEHAGRKCICTGCNQLNSIPSSPEEADFAAAPPPVLEPVVTPHPTTTRASKKVTPSTLAIIGLMVSGLGLSYFWSARAANLNELSQNHSGIIICGIMALASFIFLAVSLKKK
jgi:hypothetical protein